MDDRWVYLQLRHPPPPLLLVDQVQLCVILPICVITAKKSYVLTISLCSYVFNRCLVRCYGLWRGSIHRAYLFYLAIPGGWDDRDQYHPEVVGEHRLLEDCGRAGVASTAGPRQRNVRVSASLHCCFMRP